MNDDVSAAKSPGTPRTGGPSGAEHARPPPAVPDHELIRCIGIGGYGEVWLSRNVMGTYRAVKVVYRDRFEDERPYEREYSGIQKFEPISRTHEGLVDVLQVGRNDRAGYFYYVMELADAMPMARRADGSGLTVHGPEAESEPAASAISASIDSQPSAFNYYCPRTLRHDLGGCGRLPLADCLSIGLKLASALEHLHAHGLVHRDIKPSNIIFVQGEPKLADIGLVADVREAKSLVGTEGFIPPEGPGTPQADIYSLGKVLYEMATGKDRQSFPEPPTLLEEFTDRKQLLELNEIILKACENDPRKRYRSAVEMREELGLLQAGKSVRRLHAMERRLAILTRSAWVAVAVALVLGAGFLFATHEKHQAVLEAQRADREARRARLAEADAEDRLRVSYLAQAQAVRWSRRAGRRFDAIELLKKAAEIRPSLELRNEAIACMALTDLRVIKEWHAYLTERIINFDARYERYVFADDSGIVRVCRVQDAGELAQFPGYEPPFRHFQFSPDDHLLFLDCGQDGNRAEILDLDRKKPVFRLNEAGYRTMDFSADNRLMAISYEREKDNWPVYIFNLELNKRVASFGHGSLPYHVRFHPKQFSRLLISDQSPQVRIWDWEAGKVVQTFLHPDWVTGIDWDPEGKIVATGCGDNKVRLWDAATGRERATLAGHEWSVVQVTFNPGGDFLVSRGWEGVLRLWDVHAQRELVSKPILGFAYPFGRANNQFGVCIAHGRLGVVEAVAGHGYRVFRNHWTPDERCYGCDFSPDGRLIASAHSSGVRLWDVRTGKVIAEVFTEPWERFVSFHPNGNSLFLSTSQGVEEWQMEHHSPADAVTLKFRRRFGVDAPLGRILLSRDGRTLATRGSDALHLFDLATSQETGCIRPTESPGFAALSPDAQFAATWARSWGSTNVQVWDVASSNIVHVLQARYSRVAAFSPNDQWLVVGDEVEYRAWDFRTWQSLWAVPREAAAGFWAKMAFSQDSRMLAVAISRTTVRLVEAATGREIATLEAPERMDIHWMTFNPEGTQLAVVGGSGPIQLWDLRLIRQQLASMNLDWEMPLLP